MDRQQWSAGIVARRRKKQNRPNHGQTTSDPMNEHEKQTKADWDDARAAWRCEDGRRPQTKGYPTRGDHGAAGTAGRGQVAGSVQCAGDVASGLDHRKDQEVTPVISWQNA